MRMSPKIKERFEVTGWSVAIAMLSVVIWFLVQINNKIDYSYKANVEQQEINKGIDEKMKDLKIGQATLSTRQDFLSERLYTVEAKLKFKIDEKDSHQNQNQ